MNRVFLAATSLLIATPLTVLAQTASPLTRYVQPGQLRDVIAAADGSTIILAAGTYRECGVFSGSNITIRAETPGTAVFDGVSCQGKAIFVIRGNDVSVEGVVFRNAAVPDRNGAGIRMEGRGLTIRHSQFRQNENGILVNPGSGAVLIEDSMFDGNGSCAGAGGCAHGIYVNAIDSLTVRRSTFVNTRQGHHIKSRARATTVEDSVIDDNAQGTSSYHVDIPNGGAVALNRNLFIKGPRTGNNSSFVSYGVEGVIHDSPNPRLTGNRFVNRLTVPTAVVLRGINAKVPAFSENVRTGDIRKIRVVGQ
jgi:hypothetical protein